MTDDITLRLWTAADLPVLERSNTEEMMAFLGGPETPQQLEERHARYLRLDESGEARMFTISIPGEPEPVGSVGYWSALWRGEPVYESGWSIATPFQGRGIATRALVACLRDAAARNEFERVLAFPRVDNRGSNSLCRSTGFQFRGEEDFEYPKGRPIRVNAWSLELAELRRPAPD